MGVKGTRLPICKHNARIMGCGRYVYALKQACPASKKHAHAQCSHHGCGRYYYALKQACPASQKSRGVGGGRSPPSMCKHNARIMGVEGIRML